MEGFRLQWFVQQHKRQRRQLDERLLDTARTAGQGSDVTLPARSGMPGEGAP